MQLRKLMHSNPVPAFYPVHPGGDIVRCYGTVSEPGRRRRAEMSSAWLVCAHGHLCGSQRPSAARHTAPRHPGPPLSSVTSPRAHPAPSSPGPRPSPGPPLVLCNSEAWCLIVGWMCRRSALRSSSFADKCLSVSFSVFLAYGVKGGACAESQMPETLYTFSDVSSFSAFRIRFFFVWS